MPGLPELPARIPLSQVQEDGDTSQQPIYQTHRGKNPEGHDRKPPYIKEMDGFGQYGSE